MKKTSWSLNPDDTRRLPGLDAVRFILSWPVLFAHIELVRNWFGLPNIYTDSKIYHTGSICVSLFFTLSGFVITHVLMTEHRKTGKFNIRRFWIRRILRIWPLYVVSAILIRFVLLNFDPFQTQALSNWVSEPTSTKNMFLFGFLHHLNIALYGSFPYLDPLWSISVEELFYLLFPLLLVLIKPGIRLFAGATLLFVCCKLTYYLYIPELFDCTNGKPAILWKLIFMMRYECIGIGIVGWYIFDSRNRFTTFLEIKGIQIMLLLLLVSTLLWSDLFAYQHSIPCILAVLLFIPLASGKIFGLNFLYNKYLNYLGNTAYACYMWQLPVTGIIYAFLPAQHTIVNDLLIRILIILTVWIVSVCSWEFLEKPVLKLYRYIRPN